MELKHQAVSARKWRAAIRQIVSHFPNHLPPILFLTDPDRTPDPTSILPLLPLGSGVIYRHFGADNRFKVARELADISRARGLAFLIAADPHLALTVGADGVHWPEARLSEARRWRGRFPIQTASAHSRRAISTATRQEIDAVLVSSVFPSQSKSAGRPLGAPRFRALLHNCQVPVYALGGINAQNASRISRVAGLSTVSGFKR